MMAMIPTMTKNALRAPDSTVLACSESSAQPLRAAPPRPVPPDGAAGSLLIVPVRSPALILLNANLKAGFQGIAGVSRGGQPPSGGHSLAVVIMVTRRNRYDTDRQSVIWPTQILPTTPQLFLPKRFGGSVTSGNVVRQRSWFLV
jgi:hypothetical protein